MARNGAESYVPLHLRPLGSFGNGMARRKVMPSLPFAQGWKAYGTRTQYTFMAVPSKTRPAKVLGRCWQHLITARCQWNERQVCRFVWLDGCPRQVPEGTVSPLEHNPPERDRIKTHSKSHSLSRSQSVVPDIWHTRRHPFVYLFVQTNHFPAARSLLSL